jgi:TRAP-type C4-dicarboxylate transport system permease small subunit
MKKPMHFFGSLGTLFFLLGFIILAWLSVEKLFNNVYKITERPMFYLGLLVVIFGSQMFLTGFLGELISRNSAIRNQYLVEEEI